MALLTAYGELGLNGASSATGRSSEGTSPYTSELMMVTTRSTPTSRAADNRLKVPSPFVRKVFTGSVHEWATSACPARWNTTSGCTSLRRSLSPSVLSRSGPPVDRPVATTSSPSATRCSTRWRPTKPVAPVTSALNLVEGVGRTLR